MNIKFDVKLYQRNIHVNGRNGEISEYEEKF